jgi:hypothetical protein
MVEIVAASDPLEPADQAAAPRRLIHQQNMRAFDEGVGDRYSGEFPGANFISPSAPTVTRLKKFTDLAFHRALKVVKQRTGHWLPLQRR